MTNLLQCTMCGARINGPLNDFDRAAIGRDHVLTRFCSECRMRTTWRLPDGEQMDVPSPSAMQFDNGVLVVGGELASLRQVQSVLEQCGADAEIVSVFDEALIRIARHDYDLIVCEHRPPVFDATRIMKFINQHRPECATQICFILSDTASPEDIEVLTHSGVTPWSDAIATGNSSQ